MPVPRGARPSTATMRARALARIGRGCSEEIVTRPKVLTPVGIACAGY